MLVYNTGENHWDRFNKWPLSCDHGCPTQVEAALSRGGRQALVRCAGRGRRKFTEYVSDPAKPVPFSPRPYTDSDDDAWRTWLVHDQRFVDGRPDVLTFETDAADRAAAPGRTARSCISTHPPAAPTATGW